ncbi:MAG: hypothetical protein B7Z55_11280, partial [Planctomycetales bacterium 12-60-4]
MGRIADETYATQAVPVDAAGEGSMSEKPVAETLLRRLGRYIVLQQLGEGAMGSVYLAEDTHLGRKVALKIPKFSDADREDILSRFYREARAAAMLHSRHICPVFDVGELEGRHFISMAYIEGRTLQELAKSKKPRSDKSTAILIRKIALALADAHEQGIIHRDLKPANIMIDISGEPVVMDFGLARRINFREVQVTQFGDLLGTPGYMSPEQIDGDSDKLGPATDIYSLGIILYEMITGQHAFQGGLLSVLKKVATEDPQKPSEVRADVHPQLEAICLKMIAKRPEDRYASMQEVARDLGAFAKSLSVADLPSTSASGLMDVVPTAAAQPEAKIPASQTRNDTAQSGGPAAPRWLLVGLAAAA